MRILITTLPKNLRDAKPDTHGTQHIFKAVFVSASIVDFIGCLYISVDVKLLEGALATIRHSRWFEENAFHTT